MLIGAAQSDFAPTATAVRDLGEEYRSPLPRLTNKVFRDLAIWMAGLGLLMGVVFPFFLLALGVPTRYALTVQLFVAATAAGLVVSGANHFLSRSVVGSRLRFMQSRMATVEAMLLDSSSGALELERTPEIPVDSDDEMGEVVSSFNHLVAAQAASQRKVEHAQELAENRLHDLESTQAELLNAQKLESVGQLAAGIAHEINTPMQYIGDNTNFLKNTVTRLLAIADAADAASQPGATDADRQNLADLIKKSKVPMLAERAPKAADDALTGVENVSRIVAAMKRFSHPGSSELAPVDLNESITTTLTVCRNEWKYSADVTTNFGDIPTIQGHLGELNQVWLNMIVNAAHAIADRHQDAKGEITITTTAPDDDHVQIEITDNGAGIPQENIDKVLDPFFTTKEVGKGTGQGLAIAHQVITKAHKGTITIDSTQGQGTTFTITLPTEPPLDDTEA
jgi:signal transduction histidine kinase